MAPQTFMRKIRQYVFIKISVVIKNEQRMTNYLISQEHSIRCPLHGQYSAVHDFWLVEELAYWVW
jgi:hypothetical protein